jgi:hypothetical protein
MWTANFTDVTTTACKKAGSSGLWRRVAIRHDTNVSEDLAASIFRLHASRQRQQGPPKQWYPNTSLHGVTTRKMTRIFNARFFLRDSSVGIARGSGVLGFDSRRELRIFLFTIASRTALGPTQPPIQCKPEALSLGVKRKGREADHSPPSSAKIK